MDDPIVQIAKRLRGLREALDLTIEEMAETAETTPRTYRKIENGETDISVSLLQKIARSHGIPLDTLLFGSEPHMNTYFLTRAGKGVSVERTKAYKYQSLASGFVNRKADPFLVVVAPKPEEEPIYFNTHNGQEFNMVLSGRMLLNINGKELILTPGDSIYFDSRQPHGMKALDGEEVQFLAVIL